MHPPRLNQMIVAAVGLIAWCDSFEIFTAKSYIPGRFAPGYFDLASVVGVLIAGGLLVDAAYLSRRGALLVLTLCLMHIVGYAKMFISGGVGAHWVFFALPWFWNLLLFAGAAFFGSLARANECRGHVGLQLACAGICSTCNYDLTGNTSGICPECGAPISGGKPGT